MPPYLLEHQLSIAEIAGLQTMLMVSLLVMEIPTGVLADRFGHVWSYRECLIVLASGELLLLLARDYPMFLAIQFITGTGFALGSGSVDVILYESLPAGNRVSAMQRAKGLVGTAAQSGSVVAYSIGGFIAADLAVRRMTATIVMGALAVSTVAALSFGPPHIPDGQQQPEVGLKPLVSAWGSIRVNADLCRIMLLSVVTCVIGAHLLVFYQQYFLQAGVPGLLYLAMAWNRHPAMAVAIFMLQWGAIHVAVPLFTGLFNVHLPDHARATGLSLINAIVTVCVGVGGVALGWLSERSLSATFTLIRIIILTGTGLVQVHDRYTGDEMPHDGGVVSVKVEPA